MTSEKKGEFLKYFFGGVNAKTCGGCGVVGRIDLACVWPGYDASRLEVSGGVGIVRLHANEIVYLNRGNDTTELSHLFWDSTAPILTGSMAVALPQGWTLVANGQVATSGSSTMSDYDWINPPNNDYAFDNWTDRSQHPTNLDWYFNGSVLLGRDAVISDNVTLNMNGGAKFITTQWSAFGGSYIYSSNPPAQFRDDIGTSSPTAHAITYTQRIPAVVVGVNATIELDKLTLELGAQGGVAFGMTTTDHHWNRQVLFEDSFRPSAVGAVSANGKYALSDNLDLTFGGSLEAVFRARGDEIAYHDKTGVIQGKSPEAEGSDLFAAALTLGLLGRF